MSVTRLFRSDGGAQGVLSWSSARAAAGAPVVKVTTQDNIRLTAAAAQRYRPLPPTRTSNRDQRLLRSAAAVPLSARAAPAADAAAEIPAAVVEEPVALVDEPLAVAEKPAVEPEAAPEPEPPPAARPGADAAADDQLGRFTVNIEALDNYDLLRPIPVTIEPLGERVFVAEVAELHLSITGQTAEDAVQLLKELMVRMYEGNRSKKNNLDNERKRQQRTLETYIGRAKGTWPWT